VSKAHATPLRLVRADVQVHSLILSDQQKAAIAHRGSPLILTGATGTGKTTVLIEAALSRTRI
jgi:predicted ATPase